MSKGKISHFCSVFPQLASYYLPYTEEYNVVARTGFSALHPVSQLHPILILNQSFFSTLHYLQQSPPYP